MTVDASTSQQVKDNPAFRATLADLYELTVLLDYCIIDQSYRLSDEWIRPIRFTPLGQQVIESVQQKHLRLKPNDVRMSVFLAFDCSDGLLVDLSTDIDAIRQQLSREITAKRVRFPYIFGRELHDVAADLYPSRTSLDNPQTLAVLSQLPTGVFQGGHTVVGPYGCTTSDEFRIATPRWHVPGYLCSDLTCKAVHSIFVETATTSVSKAREVINQYIAKEHSTGTNEDARGVSDAIALEWSLYQVYITPNLLDVLSDGLSEDELRIAIDRLLRNTFKVDGRRLDISRRIGAVITNPKEFVEQIGRPELIQIAMVHSDTDLIQAIDEVVQSGDIKIEDFEVRVSKVRRWDPRAASSRAEIGKLGVRFAGPPRSAIVADRMLDLLHTIYYRSGIWDAADLAYELEASSTLSEGELLDLALRECSPSELFVRLVLPNRRTLALAAEKLGVLDYQNLSREDVLRHLRWKIGEPSEVAFTDLRRVDQYVSILVEATRQPNDADVLRGHAVNVFAAIEDALSRALTFCTWSLTSDHYMSDEGFVYDPMISPAVVEFIELNAPSEEPELKLSVNGANTLAPLAAGFARLAKALRSLKAVEGERPESEIPLECAALDRPFEFRYARPFLNLAPAAQANVLTALQSVSRTMQSQSVLDVRNAIAHGNREFPGKDRIDEAIGSLRSLIEILHRGGLYPRIYELTRVFEDGVGREEYVYSGSDEEVAIRRPGWAIAPRLPIGDSRLTIFTAAQTVSSGPLRFTLKPRPGPDPYWDDWPKRWTAKVDHIARRDSYEGRTDFEHTA